MVNGTKVARAKWGNEERVMAGFSNGQMLLYEL